MNIKKYNPDLYISNGKSYSYLSTNDYNYSEAISIIKDLLKNFIEDFDEEKLNIKTFEYERSNCYWRLPEEALGILVLYDDVNITGCFVDQSKTTFEIPYFELGRDDVYDYIEEQGYMDNLDDGEEVSDEMIHEWLSEMEDKMDNVPLYVFSKHAV